MDIQPTSSRKLKPKSSSSSILQQAIIASLVLQISAGDAPPDETLRYFAKLCYEQKTAHSDLSPYIDSVKVLFFFLFARFTQLSSHARLKLQHQAERDGIAQMRVSFAAKDFAPFTLLRSITHLPTRFSGLLIDILEYHVVPSLAVGRYLTGGGRAVRKSSILLPCEAVIDLDRWRRYEGTLVGKCLA